MTPSSSINAYTHNEGSSLRGNTGSRVLRMVTSLISSKADIEPDFTIYLRNTKFAKLLIDSNGVNFANRKGETILHAAVRKEKLKIAAFLIDNKADPNIATKGDLTPLDVAIHQRHFGIAQFLIDAKANPDITDRLGHSPLYQATQNRDFEIIRFLIDNRANLNIIDNSGKTVLHELNQEADISSMQFLIDNGADVNIPNAKGETLLFQAITNEKSTTIEFLINNGAVFFIDDSLDLTTLNRVINKLAYYQDFPIRKAIAIRIFNLIKQGHGNDLLEFMGKALDQSEARNLDRKLAKNDYINLATLLKRSQEIVKLLKNPETLEEKKPSLLNELKEKREQAKKLRKTVNGAQLLLKENKVLEAKKLLKVPLEEKLNPSFICYCLVGLMKPHDTPFKSVKPVVDFLITISFKDAKYEAFIVTLYTLLENEKLNNHEKMAILKKITDEVTEKKLCRQDFFNAISKVNTLLKLKETNKLKQFICPGNSIEYLKSATNEFFESKLGLKIENIYDKFEATFGNPKQFRNPDAVFIYLASLNQHPHYIRKTTAIELFLTYLKDVLEGTFRENRYNFEENIHLRAAFRGPSGKLLLEKWRENETLPVEELVKYKAKNASSIDYLRVFQQKIITDNHLGEEWKKTYPYLVAELYGDMSLKVLENIDNELSELKARIEQTPSDDERNVIDQSINNLEGQKLLLDLCENEDMSRELQMELLKKASALFAGTELQNDLNTLLSGLSLVETEFQNASKYTICASDHPCDILLMGHEIRGSCQRLDGYPEYNIGLLGPLLDGKYLIIAVKNEKGKMIARCLLKVLLLAEGERTPVLFQERLYTVNEPNNADYHSELLDAMCLRKAKAMGLPLLRSYSAFCSGPVVESIGGRSSFEYVDALRGVQVNTYKIHWTQVVWSPK
jgi:ankyrin repeat protein